LWGISLIGAENSATTNGIAFAKTRNAAPGSHTVVQSGDKVMDIYAYGSDGTAYIPLASIKAIVDGTPGTNDMPGRLSFWTTADGAANITEAVRIDQAQRVTIGGVASQFNYQLENHGLTGGTSSALIGCWANSGQAPNLVFWKSRGTTVGGSGAVQDGDDLGVFQFAGDDGNGPSHFQLGAQIVAQVDGSGVSSFHIPGRFIIRTADGTNSAAEHFRIDKDGQVTTTYGQNSNAGMVPSSLFIRQHATFTLSSSSSVQKLFNGSTNGRISLETGFYFFEGVVYITTMSATSNNAKFSIENGTGTVANVLFHWSASDAAQPPASGGVTWQSGMAKTAATPANMATAGTATEMAFFVRGTFEISVAGTVIPSITLGNANAAVVQIGSYFSCWRGGAAATVTQGNWT
jgi:hypothetical protein